MKHFLIAFAVFCCWFVLGILFLDSSGALDRTSIFRPSLNQNKTIERKLDTTTRMFVPFVDDAPKDSTDFDTTTEKDSFIEHTINRGNEQLIQDLIRSIQDKKREIAKEKEQLRSFKLKTKSTDLEPLTSDALFYPEFYFNNLIVDQKAIEFLNRIKQRLQEDPNTHIKIVSHTTHEGTVEDNYDFALKEANRVRDFIIKSLKLPDNQVSAYSRGELEPIYNIDSPNRELNHRIELYFE